MEDAEFINWLRHLDYVKGKLRDSPEDVASQRAWLVEYIRRPDDYYFIIETMAGISLGTFGLYNLVGAVAESGRWVIRPHVMAAIPSSMVACVIAFEHLHLDEVYSKVVSTNHAVLSLDQKLGFHLTHIQRAAAVIHGKPVDFAHLVYPAKDWPTNRERLRPAALVAEKMVHRWERAQTRALVTSSLAPAG
jgi:RimJ/RimL family protein N-acetyltransferase